MKNSRSLELAVGLFVVAVFAGLAAFTIFLSSANLFGGRASAVEVVLPDAMGLRRMDPVVARGTTVGTVSRVWFERDGVHARLELDAPVEFHDGYRVVVAATSILGGRQLEIEEGDLAAPLADATRPLAGASPADLMADAGAVVAKLRAFLDGPALGNLSETAAHLNAISARLEKGEGTLGRLLSAEDRLYENLDATMASLRVVTERLEKGEGTLGRLLAKDDSFYENLSVTLQNLREVTEHFKKGEGALAQLMTNDSAITQNLDATVSNLRTITDRLARGDGTLGKLLGEDDKLYENLDATMANLRDVTDRLARGEGTMGKLLSKDDALYDNVNGTVNDVREMLDDVREANTLSTFSSVIFSGL